MTRQNESTSFERESINDSLDHQMDLDRFTLRFSGPHAWLEQPFLSAYSFRSLPYTRFALIMGAILIGLFGILDGYLLPERAHLLWFIRFSILCPAILLIILTSYEKKLVPLLPFFQVFILILTASGFTVMIMISPEPVNSLYYSGLILVLIYGYTFLRLRFIWSLLAGWTIVCIYTFAAVQDPDIPRVIIVNNLFFLVGANVIGMMASYSIEYYARNDFFLMEKMKSVQGRMNETNAHLESLVRERTVELHESIERLTVEINERQFIELALRKSEESFRTFYENTAIGLYRTTPDGEIVLANPALVKKLGYASFEELQKRNLENEDFEPSYDRKQFIERIERYGIVSGLESVWNHKDGSVFFIRENATAVRDADGRTMYYDGTVEDITDRKEMEDALRESEESLKRGEQIGKYGYWEYRIDEDLFYLSDGAKRIYGFNDNVVPYSSIKQARLLEFEAMMNDAMRLLITDHVPYDVECNIQRANDGNIISLSIKAEYNSQLRTVFGTTQDITERKQAEDLLRRSEEEYRILFDSITDAVFVSEISDSGELGKFINVNDVACRRLHYSREELLQKTPFEIQSEDAQQHIKPKVLEILQGKKGIIETEHLTKDGRIIPVEVSTTVTQYNNKKVLFSIARDITERKMSEQALRQAQKLESIGTLAGGIAHDFNNLMNAVLGQSVLALQKVPKESAAVGNIQKAIKASERVADLTKQLLAYSGRGKFHIVDIDINSLIKENIHFFEMSIPKSTGLNFHPGAPSPHVKGDISQMQQVIMNLIINAGEATEHKPGSIDISTSQRMIDQESSAYSHYTGTALTSGKYAVLQIRDTGTGMDEETISKIFDPFFTTKFTGRGLGLAAVLGIIKGHNGGLRIESVVGEGTMFEIVFPLMEHEVVKTMKENKASISLKGEGKTILVIDDEASVLELLNDILLEYQFTVIGCLTPEEGIDIYRNTYQDISMVVLDYSMPGMNGKAAFTEIKKIDPEAKVLLSSGYSEEETMGMFESDKPTGFFQKPYMPDAFLERVSAILSNE
ncbi:MAG: PAS domain S-box protein [Bacteroidota bacterium]